MEIRTMERKSIFESKEQYLEFVANWKRIFNSEDKKELEFQHYLLYAILRGKDYKKCIAETSKDETKELAEHIVWKSQYSSIWPFVGVTQTSINNLRALMLESN